jgi:hypothetical protein
MLISHQHRFIFIKTKKTAGTSLEIALSRLMTHPDDVITPISPEDEPLRAEFGVTPRNFTRPGDSTPRFWNHIEAKKIKKAVPPDLWRDYLKISIERHPYEKAVSAAYYQYAPPRHGPIESFLDTVIAAGTFRNFDRYSIKGTIVADVLLRHETLRDGVADLAGRLGIDSLPELPHAKSAYRKDRRPATEILSAEQKSRVREICAEEFDLLGYQP